MLDFVLRPAECLCSSVWLALVPAQPCGLWYWRSSSVVSLILPSCITRYISSSSMSNIQENNMNINNCFRVTLYSEFLPMKARGICIMLIAVLRSLSYKLSFDNISCTALYHPNCLSASGILGNRCCVWGPPGLDGNAWSGLEVAARLIHSTIGNLCLLLLCKYGCDG